VATDVGGGFSIGLGGPVFLQWISVLGCGPGTAWCLVKCSISDSES
jgi:hypothetical protein